MDGHMYYERRGYICFLGERTSAEGRPRTCCWEGKHDGKKSYGESGRLMKGPVGGREGGEKISGAEKRGNGPGHLSRDQWLVLLWEYAVSEKRVRGSDWNRDVSKIGDRETVYIIFTDDYRLRREHHSTSAPERGKRLAIHRKQDVPKNRRPFSGPKPQPLFSYENKNRKKFIREILQNSRV